MTRNGKIARLPRQLRETINQRLENNEPAEPILAWLNPLPEVQTILKEQFEGIPISKQNLSEWRKGGYVEWEFRRDFDYDAEESRADGRHLEDLTDDCLADSLGVIITARYNSLVRSWLGDEPTDEFKAKLKVMRVLVQDVSQMRRWDHSAHKVALANAKYEDQKYYAHQAEMEKLQKKVDQQKDFIAFLQELAAAKKAREAAASSAQSTPSMSSTSPTPQASPVHPSGDSLSPPPEPTTAPSPNHPPYSSHSSPVSHPQPPTTVTPISSFYLHPSSFPSDPVKPSQTTFTTPSPATTTAEAASLQPLAENPPAAASAIPSTGDSPVPPHNSHASPTSHPPQPRPEVRPRTIETLQKGILAVMTDPNDPEVPGGLLWGKGLPRELRPYQPTMCQGKCELYQGECTGCHRTEDQIARWPLLSRENRLGLWQLILQRRRARPL